MPPLSGPSSFVFRLYSTTAQSHVIVEERLSSAHEVDDHDIGVCLGCVSAPTPIIIVLAIRHSRIQDMMHDAPQATVVEGRVLGLE